MMCSIRTAFLGSTFYTEPPRAMVKRKWAAWGARAKIGTRGRGLMFGNAMWWSEQAEAWFPHDLASHPHKVQWGPGGGYLVIGKPGKPNRYEGFEEAAVIPDSVFDDAAPMLFPWLPDSHWNIPEGVTEVRVGIDAP